MHLAQIVVWLISLCSVFQKAFSEFKGYLEINYDLLRGDDIYHPEGTNIVYGQAGTHMVLGCMLPSGTPNNVQESERSQLMWSKIDKTGEASVICPIMQNKAGCAWEDPSPTKPRGAKLLTVLLTETEDHFEQSLAASGIYKCVHSNGDNYYRSADVELWVAGALVDIKVSGLTRLDKRTYQLPNITISDTERISPSVFIDCTVTFSRQLETRFIWYRNSQVIYPSSKFYFKDINNKRLEIKNAGLRDGGIYMCETDLEQAGKVIKARQYVVLKGDSTSAGAFSIVEHWRSFFLKYLLLFLFTWCIYRSM